jgi:hypothetical protein
MLAYEKIATKLKLLLVFYKFLTFFDDFNVISSKWFLIFP